MTTFSFFGRTFRNPRNEMLDDSETDLGSHIGQWCDEGPEATLVTSSMLGATQVDLPDPPHVPVLDIDMPCHWEPSTTPGHGHLYINRPLPWSQYVKLLDVLLECGIIQRGFHAASIKREYSAVRTPWTKKPEKAVVNP